MISPEGSADPIPLPSPETYALELSTVMQTIATVGLWGGTIALLLYAITISRAEKSPLALYIVLAVAAGSIIEPIYDITYHLYWLDNGDQWTLFTAFGLPQPVWVMPAYVIVFALPAVLLYRSFAAGVSLATMAPVSVGLAAAGLWWTSQLLFMTQRLARLEGTLPEAPALSKAQKIGAAL